MAIDMQMLGFNIDLYWFVMFTLVIVPGCRYLVSLTFLWNGYVMVCVSLCFLVSWQVSLDLICLEKVLSHTLLSHLFQLNSINIFIQNPQKIAKNDKLTSCSPAASACWSLMSRVEAANLNSPGLNHLFVATSVETSCGSLEMYDENISKCQCPTLTGPFSWTCRTVGCHGVTVFTSWDFNKLTLCWASQPRSCPKLA